MEMNDGKSPAETKSPSSTLSKSTLYSPLIAYEHEDPSSYMFSRRKVPISIRESSLVEYLQSVSVKFHRNATGCQGTNNGGRALSLSETDERIRQRALTLVGGGINKPLSTRRRHKERKRSRGFANKERKRILSSRRDATKCVSLQNDIASDVKAPLSKHDILLGLHHRWETYIQALVGKVTIQSGEEVDRAELASMSSRLSQLDLIGGLVKIRQCLAHKQWIGKEGMITEETANTWRIACVQRSISPVNEGKGYAKAMSCRLVGGKRLVVPKVGSALAFRVVINQSTSQVDSRSPQSVLVVIDGNNRTST